MTFDQGAISREAVEREIEWLRGQADDRRALTRHEKGISEDRRETLLDWASMADAAANRLTRLLTDERSTE